MKTTDSPPDETQETQPEPATEPESTPSKEPPDTTTLQQTVIKLRKRSQTAEGRVEQLERELAEAKKSQVNPTTAQAPDIQAMIDKAISERVAPIESMTRLHQVQRDFQLGEDQAKAVLEMQGQFPGMSADKALTLARVDKPDLFKARGYDLSRHGMLPPSVGSPTRSQPDKEMTYSERIAKMRKEKAPQEAIDQVSINEVKAMVARARARRR